MQEFDLLDNIQIVLCNTSHPGNIGSAARAMKTMGLTKLTLVSPVANPDDHSLALSCNARDVVTNCRIVATLEEAIADSHIAIAMTGRKREFSAKLQTPKEIIPEILGAINSALKISIVFGNEQSGLTIEQQELCNRLVTIPGNPKYFSLNLAQAVQIMCYEIYSNYQPNLEQLINPIVTIATQQDMHYLLKTIDNTIEISGFYNAKNEERVLRRIQNILHKAELTREETDLLHGIFNKITKELNGK